MSAQGYEGEAVPIDVYNKLKERFLESSARSKLLEVKNEQLIEHVSDLEASRTELIQENHLMRNMYPDLRHMQKGIEQWSPNSFKNAMSLVKGLWQQYKNPWQMHLRVQQKPKRPWLLYVGAILVIVIGADAVVNPASFSQGVHDNGALLLGIAIVIGIVYLAIRRRREKPQQIV